MEESFACHYYSTKTGLGLPSEPKSLVDRFPLGFGNTFCAKFSFGSKFWSGPFGNLVAVSGSKHFFLWDTSCLGLLTLPIEHSETGSCLNSSHTTARKKEMVIFGEELWARSRSIKRGVSDCRICISTGNGRFLAARPVLRKIFNFPGESYFFKRVISSCCMDKSREKKDFLYIIIVSSVKSWLKWEKYKLGL